jgi:hypothetical protein
MFTPTNAVHIKALFNSSISNMSLGKTFHWFKVTFASHLILPTGAAHTTVTHFTYIEDATCDQIIAYRCTSTDVDILLSV